MMRLGIATSLCFVLPFLSKCHGLRGRRTRIEQTRFYGEQEEANSSEIFPRRNLKSSSSKSSKSKSSKSKSSKSKSSKSTSSDEQEDVPQQEELPSPTTAASTSTSSSSSSSSSSKSGKKKKKSSKSGKQKTRPTASTPVQAPAATPGATPVGTPTAPPVTVACTANADCASTVCVGGFCQDGKQAAGEICDFDSTTGEVDNDDCANGACGRVTGDFFNTLEAEDFVCCPSGTTFLDTSTNGGTRACTDQANGAKCYTNAQCTSAVCVLELGCLSGQVEIGGTCDGAGDCINDGVCSGNVCF